MEGATQPEAGNDSGPDTRSQKEGRSVEKTLVIVFDDEAKAYGASHALEGLEEHGDVTLDELAIIVKHADGSVCAENIGRFRGLTRTITGGVVGGLLGLAGGAVGVAVGLIGGGVLGAVGRKEHSFDKEFGNDITNALTPGKAAVIAEVLEDSEPQVNNRMAALGGVVFRWSVDQKRIPGECAKAADVDGLRVKIEDAIESRRAEAEARKQLRERWTHLIEEQAAEARRKRTERPVAQAEKRQT
jgi:uncharacterized membrane protein